MNQELQMLTRASEDNSWFQKNYIKLKDTYENEFVAIKNKKIISHGKKLETIIKNLEKKGENPSLILIEFVTEKGVELIL